MTIPLVGGMRLPRLNPRKLGRGYLLRSGRRSAETWVWPILEAVGEKRFEQLINNNKPFLNRIPEDKLPEKWKEWIAVAKVHRWILALIQDQDWLVLVPDWLAKLVTRDDKSWQWFMNEIRWVKSQTLEEENK